MSGETDKAGSGPQSMSSKLCTVCGADCSKSQRTKDGKGNYVCADCFEKAKQTKLARESPPKPSKQKVNARGGADAGDPGDSNTFLLTLGTEAQAMSGGTPCPNCERVLNKGDTVCLGCGFHLTSNKTVRTRVEGTSRGVGKQNVKSPKVIGAAIGIVVLLGLLTWYLMGAPGM